MQETFIGAISAAVEDERRVVLPIRISERPRDYFASACLLAFMGLFWIIVFGMRFFVESHHLR